MRKAPFAVGSVGLTLSAAVVTLYAYAWTPYQLAHGGPLGFGYYNATALQHGTGLVHVAYSDGDKDDVRLGWQSGVTWQSQVVDAGRDVARGIDLAFNASHEPAVSYAGAALKFAERSGTGTWTIKTIESKAKNDVTSLKFSSGGPSISYFVTTTPKKGPAVSTLKLARRSGTTWTTTSIATGVRYSSLDFDDDGNPAIAYAGDVNNDGVSDALRLARFVSGTWDIDTIDIDVPADDITRPGTWARLAFGPTGQPWVVDAPSRLGVGTVRFWYHDGDAWVSEEIGAGFRPALLVHGGVPIVSYVTPDGYALIVATRTGVGTWTNEIAAGASFGYIGQSSLAVPYGAGGAPAVAYCVEVYGINATRTLWLASPSPY